MKWYKDPLFYSIIGVALSCFSLGWATKTLTIPAMSENLSKDMIPQADVQQLLNEAYRFGKQVARNDCRRVRDKEENSEVEK